MHMPDLESTTMFCQPGCEGLLALGTRAAEASARSGFGRPNLLLEMDATRFHVWAQTPRSVWDAYAEDGYSIHEAVREEMSYG